MTPTRTLPSPSTSFSPGPRRGCPPWGQSNYRAQAGGRTQPASTGYCSPSLSSCMAIPLSDPVPSATGADERRGGSDRRARPTTLLSALRWKGRRRSFRRAGEGRRGYVDRLAPATVAIALFIVVCSILDALFTLLHL